MQLAFPVGEKPGFNPSHFAASGIEPLHGFSIIATAGGAIDILSGRKGTLTNTVTGGMNGVIGPSMVYANGFNRWSFSGYSTANDAAVTLAAVIFPTSFPASDNHICGSGTSTGFSLGLMATTGNLQITPLGDSAVDSTLPLAANTPYFVVASAIASKTNFLVLNLATGQTRTAAITAARTVSASDGTPVIGRSTANSFVGSISHAMFAPVLLSLPQLLQFADNPWAFWYPGVSS